VRIVGHRGAPQNAPENTIASFAKAVELGATAVELDVHLSADGRMVVIHDDAVDRTTNGVGKVADLTLDDIRRLKTEGGERVPTLEEAIDWAAGRVFLHVEVKAPAALRPVAELLLARKLAGQSRISSFWHRAVQQVKAISRDLETGVLYSASPVKSAQLAIEAGADALHPQHTYVTADLMREARDRGLRVAAWTVDAAADIERVIGLGVDDVITNRPDLVVKVLEHLKTRKPATTREKSEEEQRMDAERAEIRRLMQTKPGEEGPRRPGAKPTW
jgi:glycerophosphoryl diester phosphodiesterase